MLWVYICPKAITLRGFHCLFICGTSLNELDYTDTHSLSKFQITEYRGFRTCNSCFISADCSIWSSSFSAVHLLGLIVWLEKKQITKVVDVFCFKYLLLFYVYHLKLLLSSTRTWFYFTITWKKYITKFVNELYFQIFLLKQTSEEN